MIHSVALDKHRLVPLGEWVPSWLGDSFSGLSAVGGLEPGESSRLLRWSGPSAAVAICYELSDGRSLTKAVDNGAKWVLAVANLDPYPITLQDQFLSLARLRSIETARDLVVVSNTGPSAMVSSSGESKQLIAPFTKGIALAEVHLHNGITGYAQWRETPLVVCLLIAFFRRTTLSMGTLKV